MESESKQISGYSYGDSTISRASMTLEEFSKLKLGAQFGENEERHLRLAWEVLRDQTTEIVNLWRAEIIARIPHLARHSKAPEGEALPEYLARTNRRFEQWIEDTCTRTYDQNWLNYQEEIALRHTTSKKNKTDGVLSTPYVPLTDIVAFVAVMNATIRPYLSAKGDLPEETELMHQAWCKS